MKRGLRIMAIAIIIVLILSSLIIVKSLFKPPLKPKYNLILISVDTLRSDHMGVYGYDKNTTPNIDNWAKNATVFTNMRTQVPVTYPSFSILMTGRTAFENKIYNNNGFIKGKLVMGGKPIPKNVPTLAELLKKEGFKTSAFVTNFSLQGKFTNLDRGFDDYNYFFAGVDNNQRIQYREFINESAQWILNNKTDRFFLWIHLMDPHSPYLPEDDLSCKFGEKFCKQIEEVGLQNLEIERQKMEGCDAKNVSNEKVELYKTLYDGSVASMDQLVANILGAIKKSKLENNSIIVFYGDHGEGFDHDYYFTHTGVLYETHTRIPFIIKLPGGTKRVQVLMDNTRILPSLLELLGVNYNRSGSFADLVKGGTNYTTNRNQDYLYSTNLNLSKYAIQNQNYKYIYTLPGESCIYKNFTEELYDLKNDPLEKINIIGSQLNISKTMKSKLFNYLRPYKLPEVIHYQEIKDVNREKQEIIDTLKSLGY